MQRSFAAAAATFVLTLGLVVPAVAQAPKAGAAGAAQTGAPHHGANPNLAAMILNLERQRVAAMVKKDIPALGALLADDLTYTHSGGTTDTRASFLTLIKDRGRYLGVDYDNPEVIVMNPDTVLVRGLAQIRRDGTPGYPVIFADVWARRDGAWKMVAWQATRPAPPAK
jgi:ketosteroid isomerase-like protein